MKIKLTITGLLFFTLSLFAQTTQDLADYSFEIDDFEDKSFISFAQEKMKNSQFVMIGEQHGIQEVATITDAFFELGQREGYKYLCIETDPLAASFLAKLGGSTDKARTFYQENPMSIPFYNNENDHFLFKNALKNGAEIWGIDQTMMAQFRLNLGYLLEHTKNKAFAKKLKEEKTIADAAYEAAVNNKQFDQLYIFKYDEKKHQELISLAQTAKEKDIVNQLWKTRTIYNHYWQGTYYQNNNVRGNLMKEHFSNYYKAAQEKDPLPKVVFKLGANHAAKGLTRTSIYDISNLAHELAIFNGKRSVHVFAMGIKGQAGVGNPFAPKPVMDFDNVKMFPQEIKDLIEKNQKKYLVVDMEPLRKSAVRKNLSKELKDLAFDYDLLILVNNAQPVDSFK